jgi:hypothetical protein
MTKVERIEFGEEAETKVLSWMRETRLVVLATSDIFGSLDEKENLDAIFARLMNKIVGDLIIFGYGGVDVKRGDYTVTLSSIKAFKGKAYILTNTNMDRDKTYAVPGHAVSNYVKKVNPAKLEELEGGSLGYRLKPWDMYTAKVFDIWLKELVNGCKTLSN